MCFNKNEHQNYVLKLESKLIYHGVSNGLFASGTIFIKKGDCCEHSNEFNYVYDCRTNNSYAILAKRIDDYKKSNNNILIY